MSLNVVGGEELKGSFERHSHWRPLTQLEKPNTAHNSLAQKGGRRAQLPLETCRKTSLQALMPGWANPPRVWVARGPLRSPLAHHPLCLLSSLGKRAPRTPCLLPPRAPGRRGCSGEPCNLAHVSRTCLFCVMTLLKVEKMSCASRCHRWRAQGRRGKRVGAAGGRQDRGSSTHGSLQAAA